MLLAALGRWPELRRVTQVWPAPSANAVVYDRGSVREIYRNGPAGLEQAFAIGHRPAHAGSLVLEIRLSGSLIASKAGGEVRFKTRRGSPALRYSQLSARDASHRSLPARIELRGSNLYLCIDDRQARYPIQIDPLVQGEKLTGEGETGEGQFGMRAALSSDGNTALIGAGHDNNNIGAVWVFTRSGSTWTQQGSKLTGGGESGNAHFGEAVALSGDGNTAFVGGPLDSTEKGAVWMFTRSGSTWTQQGEKLTGSGASGEGRFGSSVALSSNGKTALVAGPRDNSFHGAVWVFILEGSTWAQQGAKLTGGEGSISVGSSVALSQTGDTALIGASSEGLGHGAAWVYTRSESTWTVQQKLTGTGASGSAALGSSVALSSDGNTALTGGPYDNESHGAAWVFTRSGSTWTQQGEKLTGAGGTSFADFGSSVAVSSDGNTALIGGPGDFTHGGAAWVFTRSGSTWTQQGAKLTASPYGGSFGASVALSADGNSALIGSPYNGAGAAWSFTRAPLAVTDAAFSITPTSATLNATVNPNGSSTECHFEYGTSTAYGSNVACSPAAGSGESAVAEAASIGGLTANVTYHFRVVATNSFGTNHGTDRTFVAREEPVGGFAPSFSPTSRLGEGTTLTTAFTFEGSGYGATEQNPKGGIPPLTKVAIHLPAGVGFSTGGFPICTSEALQNAGPSGCPPGSVAGPITTARWEVTFGTERVPEETSVQAFFAPGAGVNFYIVGHTPVSLEAILPAKFASDASPYGSALTIYVPTITTVPGAPLASIEQLTLGFGTTRHEGSTTIYSLTVPPVCPVSGFSWAADEFFGGPEAGIPEAVTRVTAQTSCPPSAGGSPPGPPLSPYGATSPAAPSLTSLGQTHRTWREGARPVSFARAHAAPVGTVFSFALNEPASVSFAFMQKVTGRKVKGRCVAATNRNRHQAGCKRTIGAGTLAFAGHTGTNRVSFQGRLSRARRLKPGTYTLVTTATNSAGQRSAPKLVTFTIVP